MRRGEGGGHAFSVPGTVASSVIPHSHPPMWVPVPLCRPFLQEAPRVQGTYMKYSEAGVKMPVRGSPQGFHPQGLGVLVGQQLPPPSCPGWQ